MSFVNAFVIGSSGQVSRALAKALEGREVLFSSSSGAGGIALDLGDSGSVTEAFAQVKQHFGNGDVEVFLPGAMTHVDRCEQEKDRCRSINFTGAVEAARAARALGYGFTYFSTEYVFGQAEYENGAIGPFSETDPPAPTSWYGQCKLDAERGVQEIYGGAALLVRTTMVFSWDPTGMNFLMQYLRQLESGEKIFRIPVDQISTPTYAPALAEATVALRDQGVGGVINLVGADLLSRRELVERVAASFGYGPDRVAEAFQFVKTADLGQAARRPLTAGLTVDRARSLGVRVDSLDSAFLDVKKLRGK